jgi:muramoyltetrapeptide carboxypeptidase
MTRAASSISPANSSRSPQKPKALVPGCRVAVFAPSSPAEAARMSAGMAELARLGFMATPEGGTVSEGYFASSIAERRKALLKAMKNSEVAALVALRGGYGSNYLLDEELGAELDCPKSVIGFSDVTSLQIYLWQRRRWISFYGPMVAAGFDAGSNKPTGYDESSFRTALGKTVGGWKLGLDSEILVAGQAEGRLLGGCMTLVETTLGTPWELDTRDAIVILEDRGMKPWQVDRALMHLRQAGKFEGVRGIVLGDFPDCKPPVDGSPTVRDVCARILGPLSVPIVFGAPIGHTTRAMLTIPLGVKARLSANGEGALQILEPAVVE